MSDSEKERERIKRMNAALDKIHAKNNTPEAKAKREAKHNRLRRARNGE